MAEIGLSEVIRALRAELDAAMTAAEGERVQFEATAIEMEFEVGVTKSTEGQGGVRFWVLELGGSRTHARESVQRVTLSLEPVLEGGGKVKIAKGRDQDPFATPADEE